MDKIKLRGEGLTITERFGTDGLELEIEGENILVERYEEGNWYDLVRIDRTPSEKRWDKMVEKRKILALIESNGGEIPDGFSTSLVHDIVVEGIKAEKEYEEETGKKWDWDEYDREREKQKEEIVNCILRLRDTEEWKEKSKEFKRKKVEKN